ncbi:MAG: PqqD family protein [Acidimicrobiales bacterium]
MVILNADGTVLTTLNPVGSLIWRALDGERDATALANHLVHQLEGVSVEQLERDIVEFIEELASADLVDIG